MTLSSDMTDDSLMSNAVSMSDYYPFDGPIAPWVQPLVDELREGCNVLLFTAPRFCHYEGDHRHDSNNHSAIDCGRTMQKMI
jgi:hypothetical protein